MTKEQIKRVFEKGKAKDYDAFFTVPVAQQNNISHKRFIFYSKAEDFCIKHKISPSEIVAYKRIDYTEK